MLISWVNRCGHRWDTLKIRFISPLFVAKNKLDTNLWLWRDLVPHWPFHLESLCPLLSWFSSTPPVHQRVMLVQLTVHLTMLKSHIRLATAQCSKFANVDLILRLVVKGHFNSHSVSAHNTPGESKYYNTPKNSNYYNTLGKASITTHRKKANIATRVA